MHKYTDTKKKIAKFCGRIGNIVPKWRDKLILNNRKVITSCSEEILIFCSYVHVWLVLLDMTALILDLSVIISTMYYKRLNTEFEDYSTGIHSTNNQSSYTFASMIETFFWIMIYLWLECALFVYKLMSQAHCIVTHICILPNVIICFIIHCLSTISSECNCML